MATVYITRRVHFSAAHRLYDADRSEQWNRETYGACASDAYHGHDYRVEVTLSGEPDPETGMLYDLRDLKAVLRERIVEKCDHRNLNVDVEFLADRVPSTENVAIAFWDQIEPALPDGLLHAVKVYETPRNVVEYRGEP